MNLDIIDTIILSLVVSITTTLFVMIISFFIALWLVHDRSRLAKIIEIIIYLPMAMPPVALGYGLLLCLGKNSTIGRFFSDVLGINLSFSILGAEIAAIMVSLGLGVRCLRLALLEIDALQIEICHLMGATRWQIVTAIILPQCWRAILGGAVLVFIRAISEFGATMVFAGTSIDGKRTLAIAIWTAMEIPGQERNCLILVLIALIISLLALTAAEILMPQPWQKKWGKS